MTLLFPIPAPYDSTSLPVIEPFDPTGNDPADWKLRTAFESDSVLTLRAVCTGRLSAVPPNQVLSLDEFGLVATPSSTAPAALATTSLYLAPDISELTEEFRAALENAGLGDTILWFAYDNVDASTLGDIVRERLSENVSLGKKTADDNERLNAFLAGEVEIEVEAREELGIASAANALSKTYRFEFGIHTSNGYVDPIAFCCADMAAFVEDADGLGDIAEYSDWPHAATLDSVTSKIWPASVLYEARKRLGWDAEEWRDVGNYQKALIWDSLLERMGAGSGSTHSFTFLVHDAVNPFQLETVVQFFLWWNTPETSSTAPSDQPEDVDLQTGDLHIVLIDPFNHARLGSPPLPKPDWQIAPHTVASSVDLCDSTAGPDLLFAADAYEGTLFLVYEGRVANWYRWSSYTARKWEDSKSLDKYNNSHCTDYTSSIVGNRQYELESYTSGDAFRNYSFIVWEPDSTVNTTGSERWVSGQYYFRDNTPQDTDGKTEVLLHFGFTLDDNNPDRDSTGSGGCMVSPFFYKMRTDVLRLRGSDASLQLIEESTTHEESNALWNDRQTGPLLGRRWTYLSGLAWNDVVKGKFWLIRPDEPTRK